MQARAVRSLVHPRGAVPCLTVRDIGKAVAYYRRFFGFVPVALEPAGALLRGHGSAVRLRQGPSGGDNGQAAGRSLPDAVVLVRQPETLRRRLDDWGAHLVEEDELGRGWAGWFGIRDCYGNVLAIGPNGGLAAVARPVAESLDSMRRYLYRRRTARLEARHTAAFQDFHRRLPDREDTFYLHFNAGLLHWVAKTVSYVPADVNLVLVGSDLPPAEQAWVREHLQRPFHHVDLRMDDAAALELLFATSRRHFGWLGLGCLVLADRLFADLAIIDERTAINCAWSWRSDAGFPLANPYLLFFNVDAVMSLSRRGVGPGVYAYRRRNRQVEGRRCYTRTPSRAVRRRLAGFLPLDRAGRPQVPGDLDTFETTMLFQLVAHSYGFEVGLVRGLTGFNHIRGGQVQDDSSDELLYIGGLGRADVLEEFSGYFHDTEVRLRYAIAEYLTLAPEAARLPAAYQDRLEQVTALLAAHGLGPDAITEACRAHLIEMRGMSAAAADSVIRPGARHR